MTRMFFFSRTNDCPPPPEASALMSRAQQGQSDAQDMSDGRTGLAQRQDTGTGELSPHWTGSPAGRLTRSHHYMWLVVFTGR